MLVLNLLAVTTDIACDDRASLPQRFGDSKPEALFEALLDHHIGMALERVNDCGVFFDVVHRHACDCHSETQFVRQRPPRSLNLVERFRPLWVVGDGVDRRSSENQLSLLHVRERVLREAAHHTERVLDAIPATDVQDDLIVAAASVPGRCEAGRIGAARAAVRRRRGETQAPLGRLTLALDKPDVLEDAFGQVQWHLRILHRARIDGRRFDAITCLFSAIGYARTIESLTDTVRTMARHLAPRGVLIIEPWYTPETWMAQRPALLSIDQPNLKIARMNINSRNGRRAVVEFHYLVFAASSVEHFTDRHELGLFTGDEYRAALNDAGLDVDYDPQGLTGRGLYIATRDEAAVVDSSQDAVIRPMFYSGRCLRSSLREGRFRRRTVRIGGCVC